MAQFLDLTGLQIFYTKLKNELAKKTGESTQDFAVKNLTAQKIDVDGPISSQSVDVTGIDNFTVTDNPISSYFAAKAGDNQQDFSAKTLTTQTVNTGSIIVSGFEEITEQGTTPITDYFAKQADLTSLTSRVASLEGSSTTVAAITEEEINALT